MKDNAPTSKQLIWIGQACLVHHYVLDMANVITFSVHIWPLHNYELAQYNVAEEWWEDTRLDFPLEINGYVVFLSL